MPSGRPLAGRTIVVTRARAQADAFSSLLRRAGARVIEAPAITLAPPRSWRRADRAIGRLFSYQLVIFTSVNAVIRFVARLRRTGKAARSARCRGGGDRAGDRRALEGRPRGVLPEPTPGAREGAWPAPLEGSDPAPRAAAVAGDSRSARRAGGGRSSTSRRAHRTVRAGMRQVREPAPGRLDLLTFASSSAVEFLVVRTRQPLPAARPGRGPGRYRRGAPPEPRVFRPTPGRHHPALAMAIVRRSGRWNNRLPGVECPRWSQATLVVTPPLLAGAGRPPGRFRRLGDAGAVLLGDRRAHGGPHGGRAVRRQSHGRDRDRGEGRARVRPARHLQRRRATSDRSGALLGADHARGDLRRRHPRLPEGGPSVPAGGQRREHRQGLWSGCSVTSRAVEVENAWHAGRRSPSRARGRREILKPGTRAAADARHRLLPFRRDARRRRRRGPVAHRVHR